MDRVLVDYFAAWNETNASERRELLERSIAEDAELIDPRGRWRGIAGLSERIANYQTAAPGTTVMATSGVDVHNGIEHYACKIIDPSGTKLMEGLHVFERDPPALLQRIVMFHGPLPPVTQPGGPHQD